MMQQQNEIFFSAIILAHFYLQWDFWLDFFFHFRIFLSLYPTLFGIMQTTNMILAILTFLFSFSLRFMSYLAVYGVDSNDSIISKKGKEVSNQKQTKKNEILWLFNLLEEGIETMQFS